MNLCDNLISRKNESQKILLKYTNRVPIIVNKCSTCALNDLKKNKFLVEKNMKFKNFIYIIRNNIKLEKHESLFVLVNNILVSNNTTMADIYSEHKNEDGFLYITYTAENTFG